MSIDVREEKLKHAELFGQPVLYTDWLVDRETVPEGWYIYDLKGTARNPEKPVALVDRELELHAGSVLSPTPLKRDTVKTRKLGDKLIPYGEALTLPEFCERHGLDNPIPQKAFTLRPARADEAALFYSQAEEKDETLGTVGHVRMDFGRGGAEFWHTWWPHNGDALNTPEFKEVLDRFVEEQRHAGPLQNRAAMSRLCWRHPEAGIAEGVCGFVAETEHYRFCLRCSPGPGNYEGYLYAYDLRQQTLAQEAQETGQDLVMGGMA